MVLGCPGICEALWDTFGILWDALKCSGMLLGCPGILWDTLGCLWEAFGMLLDTFGILLGYSEMLLGCSEMVMSNNHWTTYRSCEAIWVHLGCFGMLLDAMGSSQDSQRLFRILQRKVFQCLRSRWTRPKNPNEKGVDGSSCQKWRKRWMTSACGGFFQDRHYFG